MVTFHSHELNLSAIYYGSGVMRRNVYSLVYRDRPLCTQILPGLGHLPSTILGTGKLETMTVFIRL